MTRHLPRKLEGLLLVTCVWLGACAPRPDLVEILDLVREFHYAESAQERPLIDLGTASASASLLDGWSWNEVAPGGDTFVWAVGPRSEVGVFLAWARDLEVRMRCRTYRYPGAPRQRVAVLWDGMKAAEIGPGPGFGEQGFTVPAELATAGNHRLSFEPAYFGRPAGSLDRNGSPAPRHPRKLSFGCDWIEIGRGPEPGVARGEGTLCGSRRRRRFPSSWNRRVILNSRGRASRLVVAAG